jgi:hypothetical protein
MKSILKVSVLIILLLNVRAIYAQVLTNGQNENQFNNNNAFFDLSANFDPTISLDNNNGKGFVFPRTDLTQWVWLLDDMNNGGGTMFPTGYDGMIVYNTGTGNTPTGPNDPTISTAVTPGFYYFSNPTVDPNNFAPSITDGQWIRIGSGGASVTSGTTNPINGTGNQGDFYINTATNQIFGPYNNGTWPSGVNLVGPQGPAGVIGAQGPAGADGKTVLNGATTPASGLGIVGDFYLNTATNELFGPKTAGGWGAGVSLVGPQGPQGIAGATGTQGATGPQGLTGATGPQGPQGATGPQGIAGATGATGATGAQGPAGAAGKTVLNGTTAPASGLGTVGDFYINTTTNQLFGPKTAGGWGTGVSLVGPQGPQGIAGATGATGPTGPQGPAGATGAIGPQGPQGPAGSNANVTGTAPINVSGGLVSLNNLGVNNAKLADNAVTSTKIQDGQVLNQDLANNAVNSAKIQDGQVLNQDLANNAVNSAKIQDGQVLNQDLANASVNNAKLADNAVTSTKIQDGQVLNQDLANNAVNSAKIQDGQVLNQDLANNAVNSAKIQDGQVLNQDLANGSVTANKLNQMGAASGQVMQWNGSAWVPVSINTAIVKSGRAGPFNVGQGNGGTMQNFLAYSPGTPTVPGPQEQKYVWFRDLFIPFGFTFPSAPNVTVSIEGTSQAFATLQKPQIVSVSSTGFVCRIYDYNTSNSVRLQWIAVRP